MIQTAAQLGLASCHVCNRLASASEHRCVRCGARLHLRKPDALLRTWAFLLAAMVLYLPANMLPVMTLSILGQGSPSTILGGVVLLVQEGMWPLGLLIFIASIFIPVLKFGILMYLLLSVSRGSGRRRLDRTRLYRMTVFIGRWSMVDVFVVGILVALVQMGSLAQIEGGLGAAFFASVVVLTMLAAEFFDPRLIWD
jgi:paraquat-inducible protein A